MNQGFVGWSSPVPTGASVPVQVVGPLLATQASIVLSTPPSGYRNLRIVWNGRASTASGNEGLFLRFNGDTGSNYDRVVDDSGGAAAAASQTSIQCAYIANASHTAGATTSGEITIIDYLNSVFFKNVFSRSRLQSLNRTDYSSGTWKSTAPVKTITLFPQTSAGLIAGSYFCLYAESDR